MPGFRPFLCLVAPFVAAALLPVGADAAPSLAQAIKRGDAKYLKLKDLDAKPVTPNIEAEVKAVSADPRFRPAHEAYLKGMITEVPDEEVNGFLAGYVG